MSSEMGCSSSQPNARAADPAEVDVAVAEGPGPADVDDEDDDDEFEWKQGWSAEYNTYYYFHVPTGTSSWEAPEKYEPHSPDDDDDDAEQEVNETSGDVVAAS